MTQPINNAIVPSSNGGANRQWNETFDTLPPETITQILIYADNPGQTALVCHSFYQIQSCNEYIKHCFSVIYDCLPRSVNNTTQFLQCYPSMSNAQAAAYSHLNGQLLDLSLHSLVQLTDKSTLGDCVAINQLIEAQTFRECCSIIGLSRFGDEVISVNTILIDVVCLNFEFSEALKNPDSEASQMEVVSLEQFELVRVPKQFFEMTHITQLNLSNNRLTQIPKEIGNLENLEYLYLDNNRITDLPPEIGNLQELDLLDLQNNCLTQIPKEIGRLTILRTLNISNNFLTTVPPELGDLHNLEFLHLENNCITELPPEIDNLENLVFLTQENDHPPSEIDRLRDFTVIE